MRAAGVCSRGSQNWLRGCAGFLGNIPPRYNGALSQELLVIRQNHKTGERSLDLIKWGLVPYWCKDGGRKPINAKAESVSRLPSV